MKTKILLPGLIWIIFVVLCTSLYSQTVPTFYQGLKIQYQGQALRVKYSGSSSGYNYYSVPCVADWNGDGKEDLLIGYFYQGWVYLYINSGTDSDPIFASEEILKAGGFTISVGYG
jgi:hypothetical protein